MSAEANAGMYFGSYGGRFVPEMLLPALEELERTYRACTSDRTFQKELDDLLKNYCGRPTPLYYAENLTKHCRGAKIYLKLEGLAHTGAHKINNAVGQALLAKRMGKKRLIAETGAGQHGLATATVAARFGLECKVFMGEVDIQRQQPNVFFMKLLGSEVVAVPYGSRTLKDAVNAALKYWIENLSDTHYLLGSALGPHPYPLIVRDFQSVIGREAREQIMEAEGRLPDTLVACVGGGSNSLGLFHAFLPQKEVAMIGVEAGGRGSGPGNNAVRFGNAGGRVGVAQGYRSYFIQDENGQLLPTHSISAGLDYAGVGPELAHLHDTGRVTFTAVSDDEALAAVQALSRCEGIIPAMESAHAVAHVLKLAPTLPKDHILIINISGRGDKDLFISARALNRRNWLDFLAAEVNRAE